MTHDQITDLAAKLGDIIGVLREADPADRAEVYQQLGLRLTYTPESKKSAYRYNPTRTHMGKWVVSEAEHEPFSHMARRSIWTSRWPNRCCEWNARET